MTKQEEMLLEIMNEVIGSLPPADRYLRRICLESMRRAYDAGRASVYEANNTVGEDDFHEIIRSVAMEENIEFTSSAGVFANQITMAAMRRLHGLLTDADNPPLTKEQLKDMRAQMDDPIRRDSK